MVEITFQNPIYLWYLLSVPVLVFGHFYFLRYAKHRGLKFANFQALKRVSGDTLLTKNHSLIFLRVIILLSLILAASGTTFWYKGFSSVNDYVIAIDVSASMTAQDVEPSRLEAAKSAAAGFLENLKSEQVRAKVGLLTFSGATYIEQIPTVELDKVIEKINALDVRREGGTDMSGAIITGSNLMFNSETGKILIMISDGSITVSNVEDEGMKNALEYAAKEKVVVHSLGIGSNTGPLGYLPEFYKANAIFNEESLLNLANITQGSYYKIDTKEDMDRAYKDINQNVFEALLDVDLSYVLLLIALFLIFLEWGLASTKFRRLP